MMDKQKKLDEVKQNIKTILTQSFDDAIDSLSKVINPNCEKYDELITIESRLNELLSEERKGNISFEEAEAEVSKLRQSFLFVINAIILEDLLPIDTNKKIDSLRNRMKSRIFALERGEFRNEMIDAAFHLAATDNELHQIMVRAIEKGRRLPEELLYWERIAANRWIEYEKNLVRKSKGLEIITNKLKEILDFQVFDFISLGPGTGLKDKYILLNLVYDNPDFYYWYYPIEISYTLLESATKLISQSIDNERLKIKAIRADFRNLNALRYIYQYENQLNVFSILGNTIGNYEENELLSIIGTAMFQGDLLLIEVNIIPDHFDYEDKAEIFENKYSNQRYRNFILGPFSKTELEDYGDLVFRVNKAHVGIKNSIRINADYVLRRKYGVRPRKSEIRITHTTYYDKNELIAFIESKGLQLLADIEDQSNYYGVFMKKDADVTTDED